MTFEEELKHVATYSNIYEILWDEPKTFDVVKQYLMREYGKPESTARSYITSIRNGNTGLMMVDEVAGTIALDKEKVCELEDSLECLFVWNEYDNRHREFEEFKENWMLLELVAKVILPEHELMTDYLKCVSQFM